MSFLWCDVEDMTDKSPSVSGRQCRSDFSQSGAKKRPTSARVNQLADFRQRCHRVEHRFPKRTFRQEAFVKGDERPESRRREKEYIPAYYSEIGQVLSMSVMSKLPIGLEIYWGPPLFAAWRPV